MPGLFDPIEVRGITLRNRVVMPPLATELANEYGTTTDEQVRHYAIRARNEIGLVIIEHTYIALEGRFSRRQLGIYDDNLIPGLTSIAAAIREGGAAAGIQISHAGGTSPTDLIHGWPVAPSDVAIPGVSVVPRPLEKNEIEELILAYAEAADRALKAGFNIVELHGAHGLLLNQFASPYTNHRRDEYGGSLENRMRFPLRVVDEVRKRIGDKPLFYRLGADDLTRGGLTIEEGKEIARMLEQAGVDVLDISGGICGPNPPYGPEYQGYFVPLAESIKGYVQVPVIAVGGIREPTYADRIIAEGKADLIGIGRALLEDAEWALNAKRELMA